MGTAAILVTMYMGTAAILVTMYPPPHMTHDMHVSSSSYYHGDSSHLGHQLREKVYYHLIEHLSNHRDTLLSLCDKISLGHELSNQRPAISNGASQQEHAI